MAKFVTIGAGWKKADRNGDTFLSCALNFKDGDAMMFLHKNKNKKAETHPDYRLSIPKDLADEYGFKYDDPESYGGAADTAPKRTPRPVDEDNTW